MKIIPTLLLLALPLAVVGAEVQCGDNLDTVRAALGAPRGQVRSGDRLVLYFDRGQVVLQSDKVTRVSLLTEEEHAVDQARRAASAERVRGEYASQLAAGEALKARQLASSTFLGAPLAYQVSFWEDFSRRYPGVSCIEPLTIARMGLAEQLEEKRVRAGQEARLAELEARVEDAEVRTAQVVRYSYPARADFRGYHSPAQNLWPIEYQFYDFPIPATTSPGMPPIIPTYRNEPRAGDNADCDWRGGQRSERERGRERGSDRGPRRSSPSSRF